MKISSIKAFNNESDYSLFLIKIFIYDVNGKEYEVSSSSGNEAGNAIYPSDFIETYKNTGSVKDTCSLYDDLIQAFKEKDNASFSRLVENVVDIDNVKYIVLRSYFDGWSNIIKHFNQELITHYQKNGKIFILSYDENMLDSFLRCKNASFTSILYLEDIVDTSYDEVMAISFSFDNNYAQMEQNRNFHTVKRINEIFTALVDKQIAKITDLLKENVNTDEYVEEFLEVKLNDKKDGYVVTGTFSDANEVCVPDYYKGLPIVECDFTYYYENIMRKNLIIGKNVSKYNRASSGYTDIEVVSDNPYFSSVGKFLLSKDGKRLITYVGFQLLDYLEIPEGIEEIGQRAFEECSIFEEVKLPSSIKTIGFTLACTTKKFIVAEDNENYTSVDGMLLSKDKKILYKFCQPINSKKVIMDLPIEIIKQGAFKTNYNQFQDNSKYFIDELYLPKSLRIVEREAFSYCQYIKKIVFTNKIEFIANYAFTYCNDLETIELSETNSDICLPPICYCDNLKEVIIKGNYLISDEYAWNRHFIECFKLNDIVVTNNNQYLTSIDGNLYSKDKTIMYCYANGKRETEFRVPSFVKKLGATVFNSANNLRKVIIPSSVEVLDCTYLFSTKIKKICFEDTEKKSTWKGPFASIKKKAVWNYKE